MTPSFDFHLLGWKSFQDLCGVVLAEVLGQTYQIFSPGKDGGRDGAFRGNWKIQGKGNIKGNFTVQCKHTQNVNKELTVSSLKDEEKKAKELFKKGLADIYILITNHKVSGVKEEKIRARFEKVGIKNFFLYGNEWLSEKILTEPKLKLLVPRIYGLGDLSQILDQRAYDQANLIFSSLKDELAKFVPTDAYRKSAEALNEFGFVLLLGEPASGKTSISRSLALYSVDEWQCGIIKVDEPSEFKKHWNPNDPKQLFWVDDAFGVTQYHPNLVELWNHNFLAIQGAISHGAKVIFTSRDYIFLKAIEDIKKSAFPLISESQVIIKVKELKIDEKEEILYNHIKLGNQSKGFKTQLKPYLPELAKKPEFLPEIARRLGDKFFTKNIYADEQKLNNFFEQPHDFLLDLLKDLGKDEKASLGLIFINNGTLPSPIKKSQENEEFLDLWDSNVSKVRNSLKSLKTSLSKLENTKQGKVWKFAHPTIRDAFSSLIRDDDELLEIYLSGTPILKLLGEITCGRNPGAGQWVEVPQNKFATICFSIEEGISDWNWKNLDKLYNFLAFRCSKKFLKLFLKRYPKILEDLLNFGSYLYAVSEIPLIDRLYSFQLIDNEFKKKAIENIKDLAVSTPDSSFLWLSKKKPDYFINKSDVEEIMTHVKEKMTPNLDSMIMNWECNYSEGEDPDEHFGFLLNGIKEFNDYFKESLNMELEVISKFEKASEKIENIIDSIEEERMTYGQEQEDRIMDSRHEKSEYSETLEVEKDRFDDVDA